mgnify:CR=1 FL=1
MGEPAGPHPPRVPLQLQHFAIDVAAEVTKAVIFLTAAQGRDIVLALLRQPGRAEAGNIGVADREDLDAFNSVENLGGEILRFAVLDPLDGGGPRGICAARRTYMGLARIASPPREPWRPPDALALPQGEAPPLPPARCVWSSTESMNE